MRQKGVIVILLFLLLVALFALSVSLSSAEDVILTKTETPALAQFSVRGQGSLDVCSYGVYTDSVTLKNKGTLPDMYTLTVEAADQIKDWIAVSDRVVSLAAGEEQTLSLYIKTPPSTQGTYSYKVLVTSTYDGMQEIEKTITAAPCATLTLKAYTPSQKSCSCDISVFMFELTNSGKAAEKYSLWLEGIDTAFYDISDTLVRLAAGERKTVYAYTKLPCSNSGMFPLTAKAQSSFSDAVASLPLSLEVLNCAGSISASEKSDDSSALYILYMTYLFYTLFVILSIAIFVVFVLFVKKTAGHVARWLRHYQFLLPLCLGLVVLFFVIGAFAYPLVQQHYEQQEAIATSEETKAPENHTEEPLFTPLVTAGVLGGSLILLGILTWYWKRRSCCADIDAPREKKESMQKKNAKKQKEESTAFFATAKQWSGQLRSEETAARVKPVLKWCWMTLLLLVFLAGIGTSLYFLYNVVVSDGDSEEVKPLDGQSEETNEELTALTESLQEMEVQYATLEKQLTDIREDIQTIDEKIEALTALLEELQQENSVSDDVVADIQKEIDTLQEEKEVLEDTVVEVQDTAPILVSLDTEETVLQPASPQINFKTVLIFDVSLSGQIEEAGKTRFAQGLEQAQAFIEPEGRYTIIIAGKNSLIIRRDVSAEIAVRVLRNLRPLDTQSNLGKALYAAAEEISHTPGRIVLISDLVTTDGTDIDDIRKELIKEGIDVVFLTLSSSEKNVEEESVGLEEAEEKPVEANTEIPEAPPEYPVVSEEETEEEEHNSDEEKTSQEMEAEASETVSPVFDVESEAQGTFFIDIPKNTAYRIDLNAYFVDEDADLLVYTATPGEHLSVMVEEQFVTLTPEAEWTGETSAQFTADDSNGGVVESPVIRVVVSENDTSPQEMRYIPWIILGSIIVLIIVSLISGAFAKKFHHDPGMPPEEENE